MIAGRPMLHLTTGGHDLIPVGRLCGNLPQHLLPTPTSNPDVIAGFGVVQAYEGSYGNTGRWHGKGTVQFQAPFEGDVSTPASYSGDFWNGDMHGVGVFTWRDGTEYNGQVCYNKLTGHATLSWPHASDSHIDTYDGEVEEGVRHGRGTFIKRNARGEILLTYQGDWVQGLRCGQGRLSFGEAHIEWYEGGWEHGCKSGHGKMQWQSGNLYVGEWLHDRRHGTGRMQWLGDNHVYDGQWREVCLLTPCVYTVIPLLSPRLIGHAQRPNRYAKRDLNSPDRKAKETCGQALAPARMLGSVRAQSVPVHSAHNLHTPQTSFCAHAGEATRVWSACMVGARGGRSPERRLCAGWALANLEQI